jgi:hypothetical protein
MTIAEFRAGQSTPKERVRCDECGKNLGRNHPTHTDDTGTFPLCFGCYARVMDRLRDEAVGGWTFPELMT